MKSDEKDLFEAAGIPMPKYLDTRFKRWMMMLLIAITGACAKGPIASWPTLEPLLISEGVWAGPDQDAKLSSVYSIAQGAAMISYFFAGLVYDSVGPRVVGAFGAFGTVVCLLAMAIAIKVKTLTNLLWIAYPAATIFGTINSMDIYAWLWLLPDQQNTVASIAGAVQVLADSFALLAVLLHDKLGLQLPVYFVIIACLSLLAGFLALHVIPPRREILRISQAVTQFQMLQMGGDVETAPQHYGATDALPAKDDKREDDDEADSPSEAFYKALRALRDSCLFFYRVQPFVCTLILFYEMSQYMFTVYPLIEMYPLYSAIVGVARATELVNIFGGIYAVIGAVSLILFGRFVDRYGIVATIAWLLIPTILNTILYHTTTVPLQVAAQVVLAFVGNTWYVVVARFVTGYAPPELFGSIWGIYSLVLGVGQIALTRVDDWISKEILHSHLEFIFGGTIAALQYLLVIDMWCFLTVFWTLALLLYWWYRPFPIAGSTTMAHIRAANGEASFSEKGKAYPTAETALRKRLKLPSSSDCCCYPSFTTRSM